MKQTTLVKVRERHTVVKGTRYTYWIVDQGLSRGKRVTKQFTTKTAAEQYATKRSVEKRKYGELAFKLTDQQREDAARALALLGTHGSLAEAAKFYLARIAPGGGKRTVAEVVADYIQEAKDDNLRPRSIEDLRNRLGRFDAAFGTKNIAEVTYDNIAQWMRNMQHPDGRTLSEMSRRHYRTVVGGLLNYALEHDYVPDNPLTSKSKRRRRRGGLADEKLPEILPVVDIETLLRTAEKHVGCMVPAMAIGFFAGLRTNELRQLQWAHIDLAARLITVPPGIAKKRSVRHVDVSDNLLAWLTPHRKESGSVAPQDTAWRYNFDKVLKLAGVEHWPHNAMRHCFASNYLAMYQDQNKTAIQLGHRDTNLLYNHYRNLVTRPDAELYWGLRPVSQIGAVAPTDHT